MGIRVRNLHPGSAIEGRYGTGRILTMLPPSLTGFFVAAAAMAAYDTVGEDLVLTPGSGGFAPVPATVGFVAQVGNGNWSRSFSIAGEDAYGNTISETVSLAQDLLTARTTKAYSFISRIRVTEATGIALGVNSPGTLDVGYDTNNASALIRPRLWVPFQFYESTDIDGLMLFTSAGVTLPGNIVASASLGADPETRLCNTPQYNVAGAPNVGMFLLPRHARRIF